MQIVTDGHLDFRGGYVVTDADLTMQAAIAFGLAEDAASVRSQAPFHCAGRECRFRSMESLSVCSRCSDLTVALERNNRSAGTQSYDLTQDSVDTDSPMVNNTEFRLPNGLFLNNVDGVSSPNPGPMLYMTMRGTSDPNDTIAMGDVDTLIWSQTVIAVDADPKSNSTKKWPNFAVTASECALYYCVREYTSVYKDNQLNMASKELKHYKRDPESWWSGPDYEGLGVSEKVLESIAWHPQDSGIDHLDLSLRADGSSSAWNVSNAAVFSISYYMQSLFAACLNGKNCTQAFPLASWDVPNGFYVYSIEMGAHFEEFRPSSAKTLFEARSLNQTFENIAASMSNAIRRGGDGRPRERGTCSGRRRFTWWCGRGSCCTASPSWASWCS